MNERISVSITLMPPEDEGKKYPLVAIGDVVIDKVLKIKKVKLYGINGKPDWFIKFPQIKRQDGWEDIIHIKDPLLTDIREAVFEGMREELLHQLDAISVKVKIKPVKDNGSFLGYADITYDDIVTICSLRIMKSESGEKYVLWPQAAKGETYSDLVYPLTSNIRNSIEFCILMEYQKVLSRGKLFSETENKNSVPQSGNTGIVAKERKV